MTSVLEKACVLLFCCSSFAVGCCAPALPADVKAVFVSALMRETYTSIRDFSAKVDYLATDPLGGRFSGINALARKLEIKENSFRTMKRTGRISFEINEKIAEFFGFEPKGREWRIGSLEEFRKHYESEAKSPTHPMSRASRSGHPLTPIYGRPEQSNQRLAALELFIQQGNSQRPWPIGILLMGSAVPVEGIRVAIKCGYVDLDCGSAAANHRDWFGWGGRTKIGNGDIEIEVATGTSYKPSWLVQSTGSAIGQLLLEDSLCVLRDVGANDVVDATFTVYAKDVKEIQFVTQADGNPLKRNKKAILNAIAANCVLGRKDGWATLCRHTISFRQASELDSTPSNKVGDE